MKQLMKKFVLDESGQDLIEYALVAALVGLGSVASMNSLAGSIANTFKRHRQRAHQRSSISGIKQLEKDAAVSSQGLLTGFEQTVSGERLNAQQGSSDSLVRIACSSAGISQRVCLQLSQDSRNAANDAY